MKQRDMPPVIRRNVALTEHFVALYQGNTRNETGIRLPYLFFRDLNTLKISPQLLKKIYYLCIHYVAT